MTFFSAPQSEQIPLPRQKLFVVERAFVTRLACRRRGSLSSLAMQSSQYAPPISRSQRLMRFAIVTAYSVLCDDSADSRDTDTITIIRLHVLSNVFTKDGK